MAEWRDPSLVQRWTSLFSPTPSPQAVPIDKRTNISAPRNDLFFSFLTVMYADRREWAFCLTGAFCSKGMCCRALPIARPFFNRERNERDGRIPNSHYSLSRMGLELMQSSKSEFVGWILGTQRILLSLKVFCINFRSKTYRYVWNAIKYVLCAWSDS